MISKTIVDQFFTLISLPWFDKMKIDYGYYCNDLYREYEHYSEDEIDEHYKPRDFKNYCWDNSVNFHWIENGEPDYNYQKGGKASSKGVLDYLSSTVSSLSNINDKYNLIKEIQKILDEESLKYSKTENIEYNETVKFLIEKINEVIQDHFDEIITLKQTSIADDEKLKVDLNLNQLTVLLLLLDRSQIISLSDNRLGFIIDFVTNYLLYKDDVTGKYNLPRSFQKQLYNLRTQYSEWQTPLEEIFRKLDHGREQFLKLTR